MAGGAAQGMRLADTITARAHRNYLVAAMAAVPLSVADQPVDPETADFDPSRIPSGVGEALGKYSERMLGPDHPGTLTSRNNLATARRAVSGPDRIVPGAARDASDERTGQSAAARCGLRLCCRRPATCRPVSRRP
jgi:hypothetical protein